MEVLQKESTEELEQLFDLLCKVNNSATKGNNFKDVVNIILEENAGLVLIEKEKNEIRHYFIALDMFVLNKDIAKKALKAFIPVGKSKDSYEKEIDFLQEELIYNCKTTFLVLTDFLNDFDFFYNEFTKAILESYLNYNLIFIQKGKIPADKIAEENEKRIYSFVNHKNEVEIVHYDSIELYEREKFSYLRICRFNELLKIYDDERLSGISLILPEFFESEDLKEVPFDFITLEGFTAATSNGENVPYFKSELGTSVKARIYTDIPFDIYYRLEHSLNLFSVNLGVKMKSYRDEIHQCILFSIIHETERNLYSNSLHKKLIDEKNLKTHGRYQGETKLISDIYTVIPARYESLSRTSKYLKRENNFISNNIISGLAFQENLEYGVDESNNSRLKKYIKRIDLGTIYVIMKKEPQYNYYSKMEDNFVIEDEFVPVRLLATLDTDTHTAVLYMVYLGFNSKASKYLDLISRNDVFVYVPSEEKQIFEDFRLNKIINKEKVEYNVIPLPDYVFHKFGIEKLGVPRNLVVSPFKKDVIDERMYDEYISSILYAEKSYDEEEELGKIVINKSDNMLINKNLFNYAETFISRVTVFQCGKAYHDYVVERIDFAVVQLFYLELIALELSAIYNANSRIARFITNYNIQSNNSKVSIMEKLKQRIVVSNGDVLNEIDGILEEYAKTLDFWDVPMKYYSSKRTLDTIRKTFEVERDISQLERNRKEISSIYKSKKTKRDASFNWILSTLGVMLTLSKGIELLLSASKDPNATSLEKIMYTSLSDLVMIRIAIPLILLILVGKIILSAFKKKNRTEKKSVK